MTRQRHNIRLLYRVISIIIAIVFISESTVLPAPVTAPQSTTNCPLQKIHIPELYGKIEKCPKDLSPSVRDPLSKLPAVILIKDAHCVYEAQKNIEKILDILIRDYKIDFVCVEGASDKVDTSAFQSVPDKEARERASDKFVKKGYLTASEALSIGRAKELPFTIWGVEDAKLYAEDLRLFREATKINVDAIKFIRDAEEKINGLKNKIYNPLLKEFDEKMQKYKRNEMPLTEWIEMRSKEYGVRRKENKNFNLVQKLINLEDKTDFKKVEEEREERIKKLQETMPKEEIKELIQKSLLFRLGKIPALEYYRYIYPLGERSKAGGQLCRYIRLLKLRSKIDETALLKEIDRITEETVKGLIRSGAEENLYKTEKFVQLLNKLFRLEINREELEYYRANRDEFSICRIADFLNIDKDLMGKAEECLAPAEEFYRLAKERDKILVENMLKKMKDEKKQTAVIIAGGFHGEGIQEELASEGISCAVITPKITKVQENNPYLNLMMNERLDIDALLPKNIALPVMFGEGAGDIKAYGTALKDLAGLIIQNTGVSVRELRRRIKDKRQLVLFEDLVRRAGLKGESSADKLLEPDIIAAFIKKFTDEEIRANGGEAFAEYCLLLLRLSCEAKGIDYRYKLKELLDKGILPIQIKNQILKILGEQNDHEVIKEMEDFVKDFRYSPGWALRAADAMWKNWELTHETIPIVKEIFTIIENTRYGLDLVIRRYYRLLESFSGTGLLRKENMPLVRRLFQVLSEIQDWPQKETACERLADICEGFKKGVIPRDIIDLELFIILADKARIQVFKYYKELYDMASVVSPYHLDRVILNIELLKAIAENPEDSVYMSLWEMALEVREGRIDPVVLNLQLLIAIARYANTSKTSAYRRLGELGRTMINRCGFLDAQLLIDITEQAGNKAPPAYQLLEKLYRLGMVTKENLPKIRDLFIAIREHENFSYEDIEAFIGNILFEHLSPLILNLELNMAVLRYAKGRSISDVHEWFISLEKSHGFFGKIGEEGVKDLAFIIKKTGSLTGGLLGVIDTILEKQIFTLPDAIEFFRRLFQDGDYAEEIIESLKRLKDVLNGDKEKAKCLKGVLGGWLFEITNCPVPSNWAGEIDAIARRVQEGGEAGEYDAAGCVLRVTGAPSSFEGQALLRPAGFEGHAEEKMPDDVRGAGMIPIIRYFLEKIGLPVSYQKWVQPLIEQFIFWNVSLVISLFTSGINTVLITWTGFVFLHLFRNKAMPEAPPVSSVFLIAGLNAVFNYIMFQYMPVTSESISMIIVQFIIPAVIHVMLNVYYVNREIKERETEVSLLEMRLEMQVREDSEEDRLLGIKEFKEYVDSIRNNREGSADKIGSSMGFRKIFFRFREVVNKTEKIKGPLSKEAIIAIAEQVIRDEEGTGGVRIPASLSDLTHLGTTRPPPSGEGTKVDELANAAEGDGGAESLPCDDEDDESDEDEENLDYEKWRGKGRDDVLAALREAGVSIADNDNAEAIEDLFSNIDKHCKDENYKAFGMLEQLAKAVKEGKADKTILNIPFLAFLARTTDPMDAFIAFKGLVEAGLVNENSFREIQNLFTAIAEKEREEGLDMPDIYDALRRLIESVNQGKADPAILNISLLTVIAKKAWPHIEASYHELRELGEAVKGGRVNSVILNIPLFTAIAENAEERTYDMYNVLKVLAVLHIFEGDEIVVFFSDILKSSENLRPVFDSLVRLKNRLPDDFREIERQKELLRHRLLAIVSDTDNISKRAERIDILAGAMQLYSCGVFTGTKEAEDFSICAAESGEYAGQVAEILGGLANVILTSKEKAERFKGELGGWLVEVINRGDPSKWAGEIDAIARRVQEGGGLGEYDAAEPVIASPDDSRGEAILSAAAGIASSPTAPRNDGEQGDGYIMQGTEAIKKFNPQSAVRAPHLEQGDGFEVYLFDAIVEAENDFVLGVRAKGKIYLAREVVEAIKEEDVLKELLWHEKRCEGNEKNHYALIAEQQKEFRQNYGEVLMDPVTGKIAKGRLGEILRKTINKKLTDKIYALIDKKYRTEKLYDTLMTLVEAGVPIINNIEAIKTLLINIHVNAKDNKKNVLGMLEQLINGLQGTGTGIIVIIDIPLSTAIIEKERMCPGTVYNELVQLAELLKQGKLDSINIPFLADTAEKAERWAWDACGEFMELAESVKQGKADPVILNVPLLNAIAEKAGMGAGPAYKTLRELAESVRNGTADSMILNIPLLIVIAENGGESAWSAYEALMKLAESVKQGKAGPIILNIPLLNAIAEKAEMGAGSAYEALRELAESVKQGNADSIILNMPLLDTIAENAEWDIGPAYEALMELGESVKQGKADPVILNVPLLNAIAEKAERDIGPAYEALMELAESVKQGKADPIILNIPLLNTIAEKAESETWFAYKALRRLGESVKQGKADSIILNMPLLNTIAENAKLRIADVYHGLVDLAEFVKEGKADSIILDIPLLNTIAENAGGDGRHAYDALRELAESVKNGTADSTVLDLPFLTAIAKKAGWSVGYVYYALKELAESVRNGTADSMILNKPLLIAMADKEGFDLSGFYIVYRDIFNPILRLWGNELNNVVDIAEERIRDLFDLISKFHSLGIFTPEENVRFIKGIMRDKEIFKQMITKLNELITVLDSDKEKAESVKDELRRWLVEVTNCRDPSKWAGEIDKIAERVQEGGGLGGYDAAGTDSLPPPAPPYKGGEIMQGTEAIKKFNPQSAVRAPELEQGDGFEVYLFDAIVEGENDFVLGVRAEGKIYLAREVVEAIKDEEDVLKELLWHEKRCEGNEKNHYALIAEQQKIFPQNYGGVLTDPVTGKIAKGKLGEILRNVIKIKLKPIVLMELMKNLVRYGLSKSALLEITNTTEVSLEEGQSTIGVFYDSGIVTRENTEEVALFIINSVNESERLGFGRHCNLVIKEFARSGAIRRNNLNKFASLFRLIVEKREGKHLSEVYSSLIQLAELRNPAVLDIDLLLEIADKSGGKAQQVYNVLRGLAEFANERNLKHILLDLNLLKTIAREAKEDADLGYTMLHRMARFFMTAGAEVRDIVLNVLLLTKIAEKSGKDVGDAYCFLEFVPSAVLMLWRNELINIVDTAEEKTKALFFLISKFSSLGIFTPEENVRFVKEIMRDKEIFKQMIVKLNELITVLDSDKEKAESVKDVLGGWLVEITNCRDPSKWAGEIDKIVERVQRDEAGMYEAAGTDSLPPPAPPYKGGEIMHGTEAIKKFDPQSAVRAPELEQGDGFEVYLFDAIVEGEDDFVLGLRAEGKIYLAREVVEAIDEDEIRELLQYEKYCDGENPIARGGRLGDILRCVIREKIVLAELKKWFYCPPQNRSEWDEETIIAANSFADALYRIGKLTFADVKEVKELFAMIISGGNIKFAFRSLTEIAVAIKDEGLDPIIINMSLLKMIAEKAGMSAHSPYGDLCKLAREIKNIGLEKEMLDLDLLMGLVVGPNTNKNCGYVALGKFAAAGIITRDNYRQVRELFIAIARNAGDWFSYDVYKALQVLVFMGICTRDNVQQIQDLMSAVANKTKIAGTPVCDTLIKLEQSGLITKDNIDGIRDAFFIQRFESGSSQDDSDKNRFYYSFLSDLIAKKMITRDNIRQVRHLLHTILINMEAPPPAPVIRGRGVVMGGPAREFFLLPEIELLPMHIPDLILIVEKAKERTRDVFGLMDSCHKNGIFTMQDNLKFFKKAMEGGEYLDQIIQSLKKLAQVLTADSNKVMSFKDVLRGWLVEVINRGDPSKWAGEIDAIARRVQEGGEEGGYDAVGADSLPPPTPPYKGGEIMQGTEAIKKFNPQSAVRDQELEQGDGFEVYLFDAIVEGENDFVLGVRAEGKIYLAREVVEAINEEDVLKELLWHEKRCTGNEKNHYALIAEQQREFSQNYGGVLTDPVTGKIAKGKLGEVLRMVIREKLYGKTVLLFEPAEIEKLKRSYKDTSSVGGVEKVKAIDDEFIGRHKNIPEEVIRLVLAGIKAELVNMWVLPHTIVADGREFYFLAGISDAARVDNLVGNLDLRKLFLRREERERFEFLKHRIEMYNIIMQRSDTPSQWAWIIDVIMNYVVRDDYELLRYFDEVNVGFFYETLKEWNQNIKIKKVTCEKLEKLINMISVVPERDLVTAVTMFNSRVLGLNVKSAAGSIENVKNMFIMFICSGAKETNEMLAKLPELSAEFDNADNKELMFALAEIAKGVKRRGLNEFVDLLLKDYKKLIKRDIKRFQMLGVIMANTGMDGFRKINFNKIRARYNVSEGSLEEVELLKIISELSTVAADGTGGLLDELLDTYCELTGDNLDDFNNLLKVLRAFIRVVNFHYDFEKMVNDGLIGRINNETYYVSLRDLKKALHVIGRDFHEGVSLNEAVKNAVMRRYYYRVNETDKREIKKLMKAHGIIGINENLDYIYDFDGMTSGSSEIKVSERKKGYMGQRKYEEAVEVKEGDKKTILDINLANPFTGFSRNLVMNETTRRNLARLLVSMDVKEGEKFNPVMLFGVTSGGKSTIAQMASDILGTGYTRIQVTERTDEFDLFGSFQPYEIKIPFEEAIKKIEDSLDHEEFNKLGEAISRLKYNEERRLFDDFANDEQRAEYDSLTGRTKLDFMAGVVREGVRRKTAGFIREAKELIQINKRIIEKEQRGESLTSDELYKKERVRLIQSFAALLEQEIGLRFVEGRFLTAYRRGDLILLDEINLANEEMLGVLYQMLTMYLEYNGEVIRPVKGAIPRVVATANPSSYESRNRMSEAFMNRFEIIHIDDMTADEMAEIVRDILRQDGIELEGDLGITQEQLTAIAGIQKSLNNLLEAGKFLNMGDEQNYVFTLRNLLRIARDAAERRDAGEAPNFETWIREAYLEYSGVLIRENSAEFNPDNADYKLLRNVFNLHLKLDTGDKSGEDVFDEIVKKYFKHPLFEYRRNKNEILLDGIVTKGNERDSAGFIKEMIAVDSTKRVEIQILKGIRRNEPLLLIGQSGGGKTEMIGDMAERLGRKYISVSLGDATLESLAGTMEYDRREKRFKYRQGILVKAMEEGAILVLEELNMAKSGILEILNEYFDEGTFTNPFTLEKVNVNPNFRLFATMNPIGGMKGDNSGRRNLSPALRNRFREVWVSHEKPDPEIKLIIEGRFSQNGVSVTEETVNKILSFYKLYREGFSDVPGETYYTSLRDVIRIVEIISLLKAELGMDEQSALCHAIDMVYGCRMDAEETRDAYNKILQNTGIIKLERGSLVYRKEGKYLCVYDKRDGVEKLVARLNVDDLASRLGKDVQILAESQLVENPSTQRKLLPLLEALGQRQNEFEKGRFNPILLLGETAGGKSSLARYISVNMLGQGYTRIQFNERIDEITLFGGYEPREVKMGFDEAYIILTEAIQRGDWVKIKRALKIWKTGEITEKDREIFTSEIVSRRIDESTAQAVQDVRGLIQLALNESADPADRDDARRRIINTAYLLKNGALHVELEFKEGRFLTALKKGDLVVLDELNLANEEVLGVLYQLLTLGYIEYYDREKGTITKIWPAKGFKLIATANPSVYAGRKKLSEALMNRFEIQYIQNMTPLEMAEIIIAENKIRDTEFITYIKKLCELQEDLNAKVKNSEFEGISGDKQGGYLFTLRNIKRIVKDVSALWQKERSPPADLLIREAFLEYAGILGINDGNIKMLEDLFAEGKYFGREPQIPGFRFEIKDTGVKIGSLEINRPENLSDEAKVIEKMAEGPGTNIIRYQIAKGFMDPRRPILLTGQSGGGKSEIIGDTARELGWRYRSVSLGNTSLEALVGSYIMDRDTKKFVYIPGILVKAMREGAVLVLEEINMADSGLLEILNEYFDERTFTNPMTGLREEIHKDFRLFATMNPEQGITGVNTGRSRLSPALHSRFSEVWVPHEKTPDEIKDIIRQKFKNRGITNVSNKVVDEIFRIYSAYNDAVLKKKIGENNNEGYYTSLRDIGKMVDIIVSQVKAGIAFADAVSHAVFRIYYRRLNNTNDREYFNKEIKKDETKERYYVWSEEGGSYIVKCGDIELGRIEKSELGGFVLTEQSRDAVGCVLDALTTEKSLSSGQGRAFNPLMLIGETSGGKSTMAEVAARILRRRIQRIQMNQRTDEYDLFGSMHPVDIILTNEQAYEVVYESLKKRSFAKIEKALGRLGITREKIMRYGITGAADGEIIENYIRREIIETADRGDEKALELMRNIAALIMNGVAGIELEFRTGLFLDAMIRGDIILLDEINLANEEAMALIYQLLTLGYIEFQGKRIYPGKGFQLIATLNPSTYSGRNRMSEPFMNRFEIHYIRDMSPEEMVEILNKKYGLAKMGIKEDDLLALAVMLGDLTKKCREGQFDQFNLDNSYRFALRNLERIAEDFVKRRAAGDRTDPRQILLEEAFLEFGGLLDQTDRNINELAKLFKSEEAFSWDIPNPDAVEYKLKHVMGDTALAMRGVQVVKKPKETETLARKIDKLTELKSMSIARAQILKGFRDGEVKTELDSAGNPRIVHKSRPVLLVGQSGGGKSEMIGDIARELNWKYTSVSLGAATVETLVGTYILDEDTGAFKYREGVLIKAMREGYVLVLEEINMADAAVVEILNEYFDKGTFTIQERKIELQIHPDFRLFATMNPVEGKTGRNIGRVGLSPALRSRFREVWVRSERNRDEQYRIMLGGIKDLVGDILRKGTGDTEEPCFVLGEFIWGLRDGRGESAAVQAQDREVYMADGTVEPEDDDDEDEGDGKGNGKDAGGGKGKEEEADSPITEEKRKQYEELFIAVSRGKVNILGYNGKRWSYDPRTNTLRYPIKKIGKIPLEALVGLSTHESMHRYGTRYLSLFSEFLHGKRMAGRIFNILEDGRIENWARLRFGGAAKYLRKMNDWYLRYEEKWDEMFNTERSYSSLIQNFFLYLAKYGSDPDAKQKIAKILEVMEKKNPELRRDMETLMAKGVFGGAKDEDMLRRGLRGVFSLVPIKRDDFGRVAFDPNPTEDYIEELAKEQGEIIREEIMPYVYKWAVKDVKKKGEKGDGEGEDEGDGDEDEDGDGEEGEPTGKIKIGKHGKGKPINPKDWKKMWDSLTPEERKELEKELNKDLGDKTDDKTAGDSKDFQNAKRDAELSEPQSERDRLLKYLGSMIMELTGYLREVIQNSTRPKWITGMKKGLLDVRRLMNSIARGFTDMRFYKQRIIPEKKNVKFTIVVDESGSMQDMQRMAQAVGYNALKGMVLLAEVLENLGIDFSIRGFGSDTFLHKRFRNQPNKAGENVPNSYSSRTDREKIVDNLYRSIGQKGDNNEEAALNAALDDIKKYGGENHFVVFITDGMGMIDEIKDILKGVRDSKGMVGKSKTEIIGIGLGNQTEIVPEVYGEEYSIHLKDDEIRKLPVELRRLMERIIRGVYYGTQERKKKSILEGTGLAGRKTEARAPGTAGMALIPRLQVLFGEFGKTRWYKIFIGPILEELIFCGVPFFLTGGDYVMFCLFLAYMGMGFLVAHPYGSKMSAFLVTIMRINFSILPFVMPVSRWIMLVGLVSHILINTIGLLKGNYLREITEHIYYLYSKYGWSEQLRMDFISITESLYKMKILNKGNSGELKKIFSETAKESRDLKNLSEIIRELDLILAGETTRTILTSLTRYLRASGLEGVRDLIEILKRAGKEAGSSILFDVITHDFNESGIFADDEYLGFLKEAAGSGEYVHEVMASLGRLRDALSKDKKKAEGSRDEIRGWLFEIVTCPDSSKWAGEIDAVTERIQRSEEGGYDAFQMTGAEIALALPCNDTAPAPHNDGLTGIITEKAKALLADVGSIVEIEGAEKAKLIEKITALAGKISKGEDIRENELKVDARVILGSSLDLDKKFQLVAMIANFVNNITPAGTGINKGQIVAKIENEILAAVREESEFKDLAKEDNSLLGLAVEVGREKGILPAEICSIFDLFRQGMGILAMDPALDPGEIDGSYSALVREIARLIGIEEEKIIDSFRKNYGIDTGTAERQIVEGTRLYNAAELLKSYNDLWDERKRIKEIIPGMRIERIPPDRFEEREPVLSSSA